MGPHLLFILKEKQGKSLWDGTTNKKPGLSNSVETTVASLVKAGIKAQVQYVVDYNAIYSVVAATKPDIVILEAYWVKPGKIQLLKSLLPNVHWIVRNHSEVPFLAEEGTAGAWNTEYLKMGVELTSVSNRTVEDLLPLAYNLGVNPNLVTHLPNIYRPQTNDRAPFKPIPGRDLHVGCFGAVRSMKNHLQQAMGALGYAAKTNRRLFFHINATRVEGNGSQPLHHLQGMFKRLYNCELVEHAWMDKSLFYTLLQTQIDVVLQCSLTESFNIVAADAVICSVPVIASPEVRWINKYHHCDPNSAVSITKHMEQLFNNGEHYLQGWVEDQRDDLVIYNNQSTKIWTQRFLSNAQ